MDTPTTREQLKEHVTKLHDLIHDHAVIDDATREQLRSALQNLQNELDGEREKQKSDWEALGSDLEDAIYRFEGEHPRLVMAIQQLTTALANAGI